MTSIEIMKEELQRLENERKELETQETLKKKIDNERNRINNLKPKSFIQNLIDNVEGNK